MKNVMYKHSHKEGTVSNFEYNPADAKFPSLFELTRPLGDLASPASASRMAISKDPCKFPMVDC